MGPGAARRQTRQQLRLAAGDSIAAPGLQTRAAHLLLTEPTQLRPSPLCCPASCPQPPTAACSCLHPVPHTLLCSMVASIGMIRAVAQNCRRRVRVLQEGVRLRVASGRAATVLCWLVGCRRRGVEYMRGRGTDMLSRRHTEDQAHRSAAGARRGRPQPHRGCGAARAQQQAATLASR